MPSINIVNRTSATRALWLQGAERWERVAASGAAAACIFVAVVLRLMRIRSGPVSVRCRTESAQRLDAARSAHSFNPGFSPKVFGHSALSEMVRTYPDLVLTQENGSGCWVSVKVKADTVDP